MEQLALRQLLLELGYRMAERHDGWCECLLVREAERWIGRGLDANEALRNAIDQAFPTYAARRLLEQELRRRMPASSLEARADELSAQPSPPALADRQARFGPQPSALVSANPASEGNESTGLAAPEEKAEAIDAWHAEQELRDLRRRISNERRELALTTPRRQRLILLGWIAKARAFQELLPEEPAIDEAVESIARTLSGLARLFWPGSVRALQLSTRPADAVRELRSLRFISADTWSEVATLASESIEAACFEDLAGGRDAYGWADAARLLPPPGEPELTLAELIRDIEEVGGRLGSVPPDEPVPGADQMLTWVRRLRWLRGSIEDAERWGAVAGRLRYWVYKHRRELAAAERELTPEYCPEESWAAVLGRLSVQAKKTADAERSALAQEERDREFSEVSDRLPKDAATNRGALLEWLALALAFSDGQHDEIVALCRPFAEQIRQFSTDDLPASDRRLRRRLEKLKRALDPSEPLVVIPEPPSSDEEPDSEDDEVSAHWSIPSDLRECVVPFTRSRRVLFITNRTDAELHDRLLTLLEFETLDWAEGEERRIDAAVRSIGALAYDLVLGATGFMNHKSDERINRACRRAGITYVRVDRGRPLTCLLALARSFGVDLENVAARAVSGPRHAS